MAFKIGKIHEWLNIWLTKSVQRVVINGYESHFAEVQSGIPQGTVLGSLMFLLYISDVKFGISSKLQLFADDCILYRTINSQNDHLNLQSDLDFIIKWTQSNVADGPEYQ